MSTTSLDKSKIKFLLLEGVHPKAIATLENAGYTNIELLKGSLDEDSLVEKLKGVHFLGIRSRTQLTERVFAAADKLIAVGCFCIGTNQVDLASARRHGVAVFNAPYSNTRSVAELVLAEAIMLARGVPEKSMKAHRGVWQKTAQNSFEVRGKTLGIVGYGSIGSQLSVLAESLGMKVMFHDVITKLPLGNAIQADSLDHLLSEADVVTLHVPETAATQNMFAAPQFAAMKPGSIFINAARGTVVEIDDLVTALKSGHLGGAAIDVFPIEPRSNDDEFVSPLRGIDNVILTPHVGGSTQEAQENIGIEVASKFVKYSDNGTTTSAVNFPEVALPEHEGCHRILHIHQNVPGVIAAINECLSDSGANIVGQYLQTFDDIGYVVVDIDKSNSELAVDKISSIDHTVRCRVLF
ncbi:MAG: phosphoglycerate dehydrogenase [Gammaproteobacteria bacterium]|nr:phosphoglycerate dehydrogenase [Gammaproteobacteria bacterium]